MAHGNGAEKQGKTVEKRIHDSQLKEQSHILKDLTQGRRDAEAQRKAILKSNICND